MKIERDMEEILGQFFGNYDKLEAMSEQLHKEQSELDKEWSELYHRIEGVHLSHNTQAHKWMVKMQDVLARRRENKKKTILVRSFLDTTRESMDTAKKRTNKAVKTHKQVLKDIQDLKNRDKMKKHKKKSK
jgi:hypothetical protein